MSSFLFSASIAASILLIASVGAHAEPLPYNKDFGTASVVYSTGIAEKIVEVRRIELQIKLIH